jgi:RNA polymerase sigma factor (sigma-70 family)
MNAELFIALLKAMMLRRKKPVFLILDSLPAHKAKIVRDYVASTEGKLEFHFLPGYAPELNPDEMVWNYMKRTGTARKPLAKGESLHDRIDVELQQIQENRALVRSFFRAETVSYISDLLVNLWIKGDVFGRMLSVQKSRPSSNSRTEDGEAGEWQDWLVDTAPNQEAIMAEHEEFDHRREALNGAIGVLNPRERRIFEARRLAEEPMTLEDLAAEFGVSRERVRQIELHAFEKLQKAVKSRVAALEVPQIRGAAEQASVATTHGD